MEPIVSPWIVYFAGIANTIILISTISGIVCLLIAGFCKFCSIEEYSEYSAKKWNKLGVRSFIAGIVLVLLAALVPNKETIVAIVIANYITVDTVGTTNELIKNNLQDYVNIIVDGINKVK